MISRKYLWRGGAAAALFISAALVFYTIDRFTYGERIIADYCKDTRAGEGLAAAQRRVAASGLNFKHVKRQGTGAPVALVSFNGSILRGASFCSVYYDGNHVTKVFYNPWYH